MEWEEDRVGLRREERWCEVKRLAIYFNRGAGSQVEGRGGERRNVVVGLLL